MNAAYLVIFSIIIFAAAYRSYGTFVARRVFHVDTSRIMPSGELHDGMDYVAAKKEVLFGHHFASIAGTGPIVGPAIAVIWGWLPALLWILLGSVFAGAVHDYSAMIISTRNKGRSIGDISGTLINPRVRKLFLFIILFSLWIVVAIFGLVMAVIFDMYPQSVLAVWVQIPLALFMGHMAYKRGWDLTLMSFVSVFLIYAAVVGGVFLPFSMPSVLGLSPTVVWIAVLLIYAYFASVMPVWALLQPRDYVNSHQLFLGLGVLLLSIFFARPEIVAPAVRLAPEGAPPMVPFLFITVACGAISGFHALVASGTSSKQVANELDIKFVSFGSMLTEGLLGVIVIVAVCAGIGIYSKGSSGETLTGVMAWEHHYSSWSAADGLTAKVMAFVNGSANMMRSLGIPIRYGQAMIGVLVASFAGTTLDTATRIQRYVFTELASGTRIKPLTKRHPATFVVVLMAAILAFSSAGGQGALRLWPLFGISNQLLAAMVLLVATVYISKINRSSLWVTGLPMLFMMIFSIWAMGVSLPGFLAAHSPTRFLTGVFLLFLVIWMIVEAFRCLKNGSGTQKIDV